MALLERIEAKGGALRAIERGEIQREIQESAYRYQRQIEAGERVIVGVNRFQEAGEEPPGDILRIDPALERQQVERVRALRARRDRPGPGESALDVLAERARDRENLMPALVDAVLAWATVGEIARLPARGLRRAPGNPGPLSRLLFRLRPEEAVALAFLLPTTYLTVAANLYAQAAGVIGARHPGGVLRLAVAVFVLVVLALALHFRPQAPMVAALRDVLPFLVCILVYTNLHDTIGFVNPHDVHHDARRPRPMALRGRAHPLGRAVHHPRPHRGDAVLLRGTSSGSRPRPR